MRDDMRRKSMMGSVDRMLSMLDDIDAERLRSRGANSKLEDGMAEHDNRPQFPAEDSSAMDMGGVKGSDSDIDAETLWQKKTAPHDQEQEPERGADTGEEGSGDEDDWQELRDAAARGDTNARRVLEVIDDTGDAMGPDSEDDAEDDLAAMDKDDSDDAVTSQSDTTDASRSPRTGWEEDEPVQNGSGMYSKTPVQRRPSQSSMKVRR